MSTASMGKFDERLLGEKPGERQASAKRQKFEAVSGSAKAENTKVHPSLELWDSIMTCELHG